MRQRESQPSHGTHLEKVTAALGGGEEIGVMAGAQAMHFHGRILWRFRADYGPWLPVLRTRAIVPREGGEFATEAQRCLP
ncbi:hypothetical protein GCM10023213_29660 [Prosthecobacter algae]|uniref:Uncharacterized protein n=1 Tax=Prosthecobacter algae TaxID=1144682 RepID=A0ABP9P9K0_9BACT